MKLEGIKLTGLEKRVLSGICERFPVSFHEVYKIYKRRKSFDETIKVLELSIKCGDTPEGICDMIYFSDA